ncbi:reverse transcriptase domain-containing protein [Tanacetum coccineum]
MDDEPMWAVDHVVAPTLGSAITIPKTANEFAIKGSSNSDTDKIMAQMDAMTLKMDAQYKELQTHAKKTKPDLNEDDIPMSREEEAKIMQTFQHNSKAYQLPQSRNEHVNVVFTRSGKSYNPPVNSNDQQTNSENPINFDDSDKEDKEPTPQPKIQNPKPVKETTLPKPYKPKIPYPQRLRKEKMEAQYRNFLDVISAVRMNVPLIDVLAVMPNYGKFLKELISNKHKIEQISAAFLSDKSSAMIQNKAPPKLGDPESFLIPCNFNKNFSCNALTDLGASINLMPYPLYAKLSLKNFKPTKMSVRLADRLFQYHVGIAENMLVEVGKFTFPADFVILEMEEDSKVPLILGRPFLHTADAIIRVNQKQLNLGVGTERTIFNIDSVMKHSYSNDDTCFSIDIIDEILEEDFDSLLDEGSKILHSIVGTLLEEEIFAEFDKFMAMTADENSDSESDTEDPPFKKITINTDYKIKTYLEEPPMDLELKPLPDNLEYVFSEEPSFLPVIISSQLSKEKKIKLISVLKNHKQAFAWKTTNIPGICPSFCKHKIQLPDDKKLVVQKQRSPWVSPIYCVPKKGGITVVTNKNDELVLTRTVTGWRVCIDYRKLNEATTKDHFPLPFMDQMLERLVRNKYFYFLDGFSGYFQIPIDPNDQEKTTFTCLFSTYAYRRMTFRLCDAPTTFQRCMLAIFYDMIEESVEVFMDDLSVFGNSLDTCLNNLAKMLQRCKDTHLVLNWEKCHFMVKEGNVLGHKVSSAGLEVDKAKIDVISKLPPPTNIKDTPFEFDDECQKAFESLKEKLTSALVIQFVVKPLFLTVVCRLRFFSTVCLDKMAEENDTAPTRTDDQLVHVKACLPIGKSNLLMDLKKMQKNPIFRISVNILQNTKFFRPFTALALIYIQQFWNTLGKDTKTGVFSFQLDKLWFNLNVDLLRNALGITPKDSAYVFVAPPAGDLVIDFVTIWANQKNFTLSLRCA